MNFHLSAISSNAKTGPIAVSTSHKDTCPDNCALKGSGCYAGLSFLGIHWKAVTNGTRGTDWNDFLLQVKALPKGKLFRHNQAGDLVGNNNKLCDDSMAELVQASRRIKGFTYTHYPVMNDTAESVHNRAVIAAANRGGFVVNLSANNPAEADCMASLGIAPVVTLLPEDAQKVSYTPKGNKIVTCPATYRDDINCDSCRICADNSPKRAIVGFPVHGSQKVKAARVINIKSI